MKQTLTNRLLWQIKWAGLPEPLTEYRFHAKRRWRCDLVWIDKSLVCEIEGGVWTKGRHTRPMGFIKDCEKYNELALKGFRLIRVAVNHIESGQALKWIERGLQ